MYHSRGDDELLLAAVFDWQWYVVVHPSVYIHWPTSHCLLTGRVGDDHRLQHPHSLVQGVYVLEKCQNMYLTATGLCSARDCIPLARVTTLSRPESFQPTPVSGVLEKAILCSFV